MEARSQQIRFATLSKAHLRTDLTPKICRKSTENPASGEQLWRTASACQMILKDLSYKKVYLQLVKETFRLLP